MKLPPLLVETLLVVAIQAVFAVGVCIAFPQPADTLRLAPVTPAAAFLYP